MSIAIKPFIAKNKVGNSNNKQLYTVAKHITPYTVQLDNNNILKSSIVAFNNKKYAIRFAHLLEEYYGIHYIWPQFNINTDIPNILLFSKYTNINENELHSLYIDKWDNNDIIEYCRDNILNILLFEESSDNYNIIERKYQILYKVKLYNIESSVEKERIVCEDMFNYI